MFYDQCVLFRKVSWVVVGDFDYNTNTDQQGLYVQASTGRGNDKKEQTTNPKQQNRVVPTATVQNTE